MQRSTTTALSVPDHISGLAESDPHRIALSYRNERMEFNKLDRLACKFAAFLGKKRGVSPGDTVAICLDRSFDWIISALGVMRVGAAYVPLDPAWPDSRLRFAIRDSDASVVVGRTSLLDRLKVKARGIDPLRDAEIIGGVSPVIHEPVDTEGLAYINYTSGSTGVPKGVEITHANLAHLVNWHRDAFSVTSQDRASHLAGLGFDATVWEIWPNLCAGATLCLADEEARLSPELIQQWIVRNHITIAFVPTVQAASMITMAWPATSALRLLLTGGDILHQSPPLGLPFEVVNNYGPTECTVVATSSLLRPGLPSVPPIGHPIAGTSVYLLNEAGDEVLDGNTGEIYIGGNGVGRGYRNLPDQTGKTFLPDPFSSKPGARMYRTGDRGVRREDGTIEFRGRLDRQVKIRGQRVELDEVGSILAQHPSIEFAVATCNALECGENKLVAHVLFREKRERALVPTIKELQRHLLQSLPDYMVPAVYLRLRELPLSPNGKIDLTILENSSGAGWLEPTHAKEPSTEIERKLFAIVRELLGTDAISMDSNFFLAGGHSLLGMQLLMRIRSEFNVELGLHQLFEASTIDQLALQISTRQRADGLALIWADLLGRKHIGLDDNFFDLGGQPAVVAALRDRIAKDFNQTVPLAHLFRNPTIRLQTELTLRPAKPELVLPPGVLSLQPSGIRPTLFWVHHVNVNLAREFGEDQPVVLVTLTNKDLATLGEEPPLCSIAKCLLDKILTMQPFGPYNLGGLCVGSVLAYEIACQLRDAGHQVSLLVLLDAPSPDYLKTYNSITARLMRPRYRLERMVRLGMRQTLLNLRRRLIKYSLISAGAKFAWAEFNEAHKMIEHAAFEYIPRRYEGKVLLLLATEQIPHGEFLSGWQAIVSDNLCTSLVKGYHRELMTPRNVRSIAEIILSHLKLALEKDQAIQT